MLAVLINLRFKISKHVIFFAIFKNNCLLSVKSTVFAVFFRPAHYPLGPAENLKRRMWVKNANFANMKPVPPTNSHILKKMVFWKILKNIKKKIHLASFLKLFSIWSLLVGWGRILLKSPFVGAHKLFWAKDDFAMCAYIIAALDFTISFPPCCHSKWLRIKLT